MKNYILFLLLVIGLAFAKAQNITNAEYFIDTDPGVGQGTALTVNNIGNDITDSFTVNVGTLSVGFHRMYVRVQDTNNVWSLYHNFLFYVDDATPITNPTLPAIVAAEYFLGGTDPGFGNATAVTLAATGNQDQFMFDIDFSSFTSCTTTPFHLRVQDANGVWSLYDFDPALLIDFDAPVADVATLADVQGTCEVTSLTAPTATDACTGIQVTGTTNATLPINSNTAITWTYDDGNGNTVTQTQNVVIVDNTAPVPDSNTLANVTGECELTMLTAPTATDNCASTVTVSNDAVFPITSNTVVTWSYDDARGNTTTQTQNIIIADTTDPVVIGQDIIIDLAGNSSISIIPSDVDNGSNDNCSAVNLAVSPDTFTAAGIYTVTLTATDATGNTGSTTTQVTVDNTLSNEDFTLSKQISIYPNPTSSMIYIKTTVDVVQLDVYDLHGKLLLEKRSSLGSLSVESLSDGVYLMKVTTSTGEFTIKRIIKN
ncbi:T9SS type A sorting domain-containing protein [Nonlabens sp. Asnod3-A02]|uniref:T9SS type A sorting domain-containing protein n=1 Tax=Nonlabens sp. Asnod3-A02 TaxID=3160579 RepID=UPI00386BE103